MEGDAAFSHIAEGWSVSRHWLGSSLVMAMCWSQPRWKSWKPTKTSEILIKPSSITTASRSSHGIKPKPCSISTEGEAIRGNHRQNHARQAKIDFTALPVPSRVA